MVGQKSDCILELITLRWLVVERHVICQKLSNFVKKKSIKLACQ